MNCKQGELAFRVRAQVGASIHLGAIVRCVEYVAGPCLVYTGSDLYSAQEIDGAWHVEFQGTYRSPRGRRWLVPDHHLRPIRGDEQPESISTDRIEPVTA